MLVSIEWMARCPTRTKIEKITIIDSTLRSVGVKEGLGNEIARRIEQSYESGAGRY
jgi:hypothetical protein